MESVFIYLLKSSGLIAVFYLAYHFLVRKETFFDANRWFLLSGLLTSLLLPLYFLQKIIVTERPVIAFQDLAASPPQPVQIIPNVTAVETFDWILLIWVCYIIVASVLMIKIIVNLISLYKKIHKQQVVKKEHFKLVNLNDTIAPFSFFNYIVYNADLYSDNELKSILLHEKIHSSEKHSVDVLIAEILCVAFWFNPFVWLYKKAIIQNLEYIADQKAIEQLEDRKSYQHALLKVVSNQNCLPITNNFYQSLIKKRIIMLNKNQSNKRSSWKYAVVIPALIGFVFLFQIKVTAKDKFIATSNNAAIANAIEDGSGSHQDIIAKGTTAIINTTEGNYVFDKAETDKNLMDDAAEISKIYNIAFTISNVKRNSTEEIIAIKMAFDDKKGTTGKVEQNRTIPIRPIFFKVNIAEGKSLIGFYDNQDSAVKPAEAVIKTTIEPIKEDAPEREHDINVTQQQAPSIITLANGDEVVLFDKHNVKVVEYPTVTFTDNSPVLIVDGVQQKNPRLALEKMNITKIKAIKVLNESDKEVKGTPIYKMIITTK